MAKYHQGYYIPKNPHKYIGDKGSIYYRQSWEKKFMVWADTNPQVLKWNQEESIVPYISPVDMKQHRYFVDFLIMVKTRSEEIKRYAVEIKPEAQTKMPTTRNKKRLLTETATYSINQAKWKAADAFFSRQGIEFIVLTERHLKV